MKKYLLWAGVSYYPSAGLGDYVGDFDTIEEATAVGEQEYKWNEAWGPKQSWCKRRQYDWYSIVEHATMKEVKVW